LKLRGKKNRILCTQYYYGEPSMKDQIGGVCGTYRREYKVLVGKTEGRGLLGIRMARCDHTIKMGFKFMRLD
jgi:hypothetical protein